MKRSLKKTAVFFLGGGGGAIVESVQDFMPRQWDFAYFIGLDLQFSLTELRFWVSEEHCRSKVVHFHRVYY